MNGRIFGVSILTIFLIVAALLVGRAFGSKIPLLNSVTSG